MNETPDPVVRLAGRPDRPLADVSVWKLEVVGARLVTPRMRRIEFTGLGLGDLEHRPGQDLMLRIPIDGGTVNRRYTIRDFDALRAVVTIDAVAQGHGPGTNWLATAAPGDRLQAVGPRGRIGLADDASWHLFAGDESALPTIFTMAERAPVGTRAIVVAEVGDAREEQPVAGTAVEAHWLHRGDVESGHSTVLVDALATLPLPDGPGHTYLAGEANTVTALRQMLLNRRVPTERISAKGYWNRSRANAAHGEPEPEPASAP